MHLFDLNKLAFLLYRLVSLDSLYDTEKQVNDFKKSYLIKATTAGFFFSLFVFSFLLTIRLLHFIQNYNTFSDPPKSIKTLNLNTNKHFFLNTHESTRLNIKSDEMLLLLFFLYIIFELHS